MLKKLLIGFAILAGLAGSVQAAGTVPGFGLTPQFDSLGKVMPGCKLYVVQAGTTATPQNSYQDSGLTTLNPNPLLCDSSGRLPQWFVADGTVKLRLTNSVGTTVFVGDNLLVIGASSGGGGGSSVDPTTILSTGDIKTQYSTNTLSGWVRANGRTIGSASSGATERANADTQALFVFLYNADPSLAVSGGRGASAAADFAANKTITLPDFRGRVLASFDDMGNAAAGRLTTASMTGTGIGAVGGSQIQNLVTANLPPYTPTGTFSAALASGVLNGGTLNGGTLVGGSATVTSNNWVASSSSDSTPFSLASGSSGALGVSLTGGSVSKIVSNGSVSGSVTGTVSGTVSGNVSGSVSMAAQGGTSQVFTILQPTILVTTYIKL